MKKNIIHPDSDEKLVNAIVIYNVSGDYCYDKEGENELTDDELINLFKKNLLLVCTVGEGTDTYERPISLVVTDESVTLSFAEGAGAVEGLPEYDETDDEGKILKIVSGEPAWASAT